MKKILTIIIAILAMGVQSVSAQYAKIMLQHDSKATLFETTNLQGAIDASVDGDTIYIGEGKYDATDITITKKISIIGQGEKSQIGSVTINLPGESELAATVLYGLKTKTVNIKSSSANLHIDKCTMSNMTIEPASSTSTKTFKLKDMLIERCKINNMLNINTSKDEYENVIIRNSDISIFWYEPGLESATINVSFINCRLAENSNGGYACYAYGTFINCIIKNIAFVQDSATFVNCLMSRAPSSGSTTDLYIDSKTDYTDEELQAKGYLGTDGTIVGPNGGARPFNLVPAIPSLEDIKLDVNYTTKKLNVTVKVKAN